MKPRKKITTIRVYKDTLFTLKREKIDFESEIGKSLTMEDYLSLKFKKNRKNNDWENEINL